MRKAVFEHLSPRGHGASNRIQQPNMEASNEVWPFPLIPFSLLSETTRNSGKRIGGSKKKYFTKKRYTFICDETGRLTLGPGLLLT